LFRLALLFLAKWCRIAPLKKSWLGEKAFKEFLENKNVGPETHLGFGRCGLKATTSAAVIARFIACAVLRV